MVIFRVRKHSAQISADRFIQLGFYQRGLSSQTTPVLKVLLPNWNFFRKSDFVTISLLFLFLWQVLLRVGRSINISTHSLTFSVCIECMFFTGCITFSTKNTLTHEGGDYLVHRHMLLHSNLQMKVNTFIKTGVISVDFSFLYHNAN